MTGIRLALVTVAVALALASALFSEPANAQELRDPHFDLTSPAIGPPLTCSQTQKVLVSRPFAERAKLKARLIDRLRESIYDDAKGIVNMAREKEIKKLANKLKDDEAR